MITKGSNVEVGTGEGRCPTVHSEFTGLYKLYFLEHKGHVLSLFGGTPIGQKFRRKHLLLLMNDECSVRRTKSFQFSFEHSLFHYERSIDRNRIRVSN